MTALWRQDLAKPNHRAMILKGVNMSTEAINFLQDNNIDVEDLKQKLTSDWSVHEVKLGARILKFEARLTEQNEIEIKAGRIK